ncbi:MAG TPA: hypothetical protein VF092_18365 [Longimicrobium sp.]
MLIDEWMPEWDVHEVHETRVRAPHDRVWAAVRALDFSRAPVTRTLMAMRYLPAMLTRAGRRKVLERRSGGILRAGFLVLGERPGEELLLGVVGRFWTSGGGIERVTPEELRVFDRPGFAIGTWNFTLEDDGDGVRVATETRVRCTDDASRRKFRRYWRVIAPFSGLIRLEMLKSIRRVAESSSPPARAAAR